MFRLRRSFAVLSLSLLMAGATACTGPYPSASTAGGVNTSVSSGGTTQSKIVGGIPRTVATPIVVNTSSGRRPAATSVPAGTQLSAPSLRVPTDGKNVVMVDSTDGEGLWVRRDPAGDPLKTWPDFSPMLVTGMDQTIDGRVWRPVLTLDGQAGWAASEFLVPADEQTVAAVLPSLIMPKTPAPLPAGVQARVAVPDAPATPAPATPAPAQPNFTATPRRPAAFIGQQAAPSATSSTVAQTQALAAATATPQPAATAQPTATPIRAAAGSTTLEAGDATLIVVATDRAMPIKIGSRPRADMELAAVQVKITNGGDVPLPVYRGAFRLSLSDRSRVEPLAGGQSPLPYSASVPPGEVLEGWLTFEVSTGTRVDSLVWSPDRDISYALGI